MGAALSGGSSIAQHARRFFIELLPEPGPAVPVIDDEAHHMLNVVRLRPGEEVVLFDGSGREATAACCVRGRVFRPRRP